MRWETLRFEMRAAERPTAAPPWSGPAKGTRATRGEPGHGTDPASVAAWSCARFARAARNSAESNGAMVLRSSCSTETMSRCRRAAMVPWASTRPRWRRRLGGMREDPRRDRSAHRRRPAGAAAGEPRPRLAHRGHRGDQPRPRGWWRDSPRTTPPWERRRQITPLRDLGALAQGGAAFFSAAGNLFLLAHENTRRHTWMLSLHSLEL